MATWFAMKASNLLQEANLFPAYPKEYQIPALPNNEISQHAKPRTHFTMPEFWQYQHVL
jgi:hypothetical protein